MTHLYVDQKLATAVERAVVDLFQEMRQQFAAQNVRGLHFSVTASGRSASGDAKVTFSISADEYGTEPVRGNNITAIVSELGRRKGFNELYSPLALPAPGSAIEETVGNVQLLTEPEQQPEPGDDAEDITPDDDIPF